MSMCIEQFNSVYIDSRWYSLRLAKMMEREGQGKAWKCRKRLSYAGEWTAGTEGV